MPPREFDITIAADGSVEVHIQGYKGNRCLDAAKMFEDIIGTLKSKEATSEMYEPEEEVRLNLDQRH